MKPVIRCAKCSDCAVVSTVGFISEDRHYCTQRYTYTDPDDGCTFGSRGSPQRGRMDVMADISLHSATSERTWLYPER